MSAASGVDLLHHDLQQHLRLTVEERLQDFECSVIGNILQTLQECGSQEWYHQSVEWFLVYLVTEVGIGPHNMSSGRSADSWIVALQKTVLDLVDELAFSSLMH